MTFEVTDKALDFLGYRALRDLLGSLGKSSFGRHDTREQATGVETTGAHQAVRIRRHAQPRCGGHAAQRRRSGRRATSTIRTRDRRHAERAARLDVTHEDLVVTQGEYQSSCATVLMLDCSHA